MPKPVMQLLEPTVCAASEQPNVMLPSERIRRGCYREAINFKFDVSEAEVEEKAMRQALEKWYVVFATGEEAGPKGFDLHEAVQLRRLEDMKLVFGTEAPTPSSGGAPPWSSLWPGTRPDFSTCARSQWLPKPWKNTSSFCKKPIGLPPPFMGSWNPWVFVNMFLESAWALKVKHSSVTKCNASWKWNILTVKRRHKHGFSLSRKWSSLNWVWLTKGLTL